MRQFVFAVLLIQLASGCASTASGPPTSSDAAADSEGGPGADTGADSEGGTGADTGPDSNPRTGSDAAPDSEGGTGADTGAGSEGGRGDANVSDGTAIDGPDSQASHTFACGPVLTCESGTQSCAVQTGGAVGRPTTYWCQTSDGGAPSCGRPNSAPSPGFCGCYESANGEVTFTWCVP